MLCIQSYTLITLTYTALHFFHRNAVQKPNLIVICKAFFVGFDFYTPYRYGLGRIQLVAQGGDLRRYT